MSPPILDPIRGALLRSQPDAKLVALVREGRERAFEEIVRRYRAPLVGFAAMIVPADRADDVVQDSLIAAYDSLGSSNAEIVLRPWLFRIVRNRALNHLRDNPAAEELTERMDGVTGPAEIAEQREEVAALVGGLQALPGPQREAIVARELEGRGHAEIAAELGTSPGAVRQLIFRARGTLREAAGVLVPLPLMRLLLGPGGTEAGATAAAGAGIGAAAAVGGGTAAGLGIGAKVAIGIAGVALAVGGGIAVEREQDRERGGEPNGGAQALAADGPDKDALDSSREPGPGSGRAGGGEDSGGPGPGGRSGPGGEGSENEGGGSGGSGSGGEGGGDSSGHGGGDSGGGDDSGSGSVSSGSGSSGSGSTGSGTSGSGFSGSGGGFDDSSGSDSISSGSGTSGSGSSGSGSSGSDSGSSGSGSFDDDFEPIEIGIEDSSGSGGSGSGSSGSG